MPATAQQKIDMARRLASKFAQSNTTMFMVKDEVLSVVEDAYNWAEDNQTGYNADLLLVFRNNASTKLKAELLGLAIEELVKAS